MLINERQEQILKLLSKFKYLTSSQIFPFLEVKYISSVRMNLKALKESKLIEKQSFGVVPNMGRLEDVHYLTSNGVKLLVDDFLYSREDIKYPSRKNLFSRDYFHRLNTVNFYICFDKWLSEVGGELVFYKYYFDHANYGNKSNISTSRVLINDHVLIPDSVFMFSVGERRYLFVFELHNGQDTQRLLKQVEKHAEALTIGAFPKAFEHDKNNRVVFILEDERPLMAITKKIREIDAYKPFLNLFLFSTLSRIQGNFNMAFENFLNEKVSFV